MRIDLPTWEQQRTEHRATLWRLLGDVPPLFTPDVTITATTQHDGYRLEHLTFDNGVGATVYGYLLLPDEIDQPAPAVLYQHAHGGRYDRGKNMVLEPFIGGQSDGIELVRRGYVVLAIDAYAFGERQEQGPAGERETGAATELSLFKQFLWEGRTLWGMMVRDDLLAFEYLRARPEVNPHRIGTTGMSLGGSRATWLAALDERVKVVLPLNQMTRYADFAAQGDYWRHSIYYYVPGMLASGIDMEYIVSLTAPRTQRILVGDADPLSPVDGVRTIDRFARHIYDLYDAADHFETLIYPGLAHEYTPAMLTVMLDTFELYL